MKPPLEVSWTLPTMLQRLPLELLLGLALLGVVAMSGALTLKSARWWRRRRMLRRFARGREGEIRAAGLLARHGFRVVATQATGSWRMKVGGEWHEGHVRADALVSRRGRLFVVEVKTGNKAPDPTSAATRRQLLEYQQVFHPDGILLADMETELLYEVAFAPGVSSLHPHPDGGYSSLLLGSLLGFLAGVLLAAVLELSW